TQRWRRARPCRRRSRSRRVLHRATTSTPAPQLSDDAPVLLEASANHGAMGVRYYAYPLAPELVGRAMDDPRPFLSDDPLADAWGLGRPRHPQMLYLDKCWRQLQSLTNPPGGKPRPSHALVAGDVTY